MIAIILFSIAVLAFGCGFLFGVASAPKNKVAVNKKTNCEIEKITKEYENFLNYDGSEQI